MKRLAAALFLAVVVVAAAGCGDDLTQPTLDTTISDSLALGTGMLGFNLTGPTTAFHISGSSVNIYWRLQSQYDFAGSQVRIRMESMPSGIPVDSASYGSNQTYGHIMVAAYPWSRTGSFRAVGIIVNTGRLVASQEFTVH